MALLARMIGQPLSDAVVVERIIAAVMEQKLPPGANWRKIRYARHSIATAAKFDGSWSCSRSAAS